MRGFGLRRRRSISRKKTHGGTVRRFHPSAERSLSSSKTTQHTFRCLCSLVPTHLSAAVARKFQAEEARVCDGEVSVRGSPGECLNLEQLVELLRAKRQARASPRESASQLENEGANRRGKLAESCANDASPNSSKCSLPMLPPTPNGTAEGGA